MRIFVHAFLILLVLFVTSCQRELDIVLDDVNPPTTTDTAIHTSLVFRVVEYDPQVPNDSIIRIVQRIQQNGERKIQMKVVYSEDPLDTAITLFSYDAQGHLTSMKSGPSSVPNYFPLEYEFTWSNSRLSRVAADTLGVFAESFDYSYTPDGANTIVNCIKTPSNDDTGLYYVHLSKHPVTFNAQFRPVKEQWINYTYFHSGNTDPNLPQMSHDTVNFFYTYTGTDLSYALIHTFASDTNSVSPSFYSYYRDTSSFAYTRSPAGGNIADSLKMIYGPEVFTMMNFGLLNFYYHDDIISFRQDEKIFLNRPLTTVLYSRRPWINGVYDAGEAYQDFLMNKYDNSVDASGRLTGVVFYWSNSQTNVESSVRIYYE